MRYLFFVVFIFFVGQAKIYSQSIVYFPESYAIWSEVYTPPFETGPQSFYFYGMLNSDTIINGKSYHKLYFSTDTIFQKSEYCGGIREDKDLKRIYYLGKQINFYEDQEIILYDFDLEIGDVVGEGYNIMPGTELIVENIESILIGSLFRKVVKFKYLNEISYWIEGIGNIRGLLSTTGAYPANGSWNDLVCFRQGWEWKYTNPEFQECIPKALNSKQQLTDQRVVKIVPNPISDQGSVILSNNLSVFNILNIYSSAGTLLKCINIKQGEEIIITKEGLLSGMYYYSLVGSSCKPVKGVFIIK
jgi:hypothetical protein